MMKIRFYISLLLARFVYLGIRLLNKSSGTSLIGMLTLKFCPEFLKYCNHYITKSAITVTGTNGKTTTSGLLAHIINSTQCSVINNIKGANMLTGVANMFALKLKPFIKYDYAVIESDEAYLTKLYDKFQADYLLVTNLFRDQLDRYGELTTTASFIQDAITKNSNIKLVLNADDPLVTNFGRNQNATYYGLECVEYISEKQSTKTTAPSEVFNCVCGEPLEYSKRFFAQEGHYFCPKCGYKRPEPTYKGRVKIHSNYSELTIIDTIKQKQYTFTINLIGLYNVYNALGAIAQALELGLDYNKIYEAVKSYKSVFGRAERRTFRNFDTLIQLIKNPTGASEVLKTVDLESKIIIAINDNYADGRDISWLWDSDFEQLKNSQKTIITSGTRAKDMATRLKYAGVPDNKIKVIENIKEAIISATSEEESNGKLTILPSYTALLKINKMKF